MASAAAAAYDRLAELKAFDETKAGVKGLVDAGITELPGIFHLPPHLLDGRPSAPADDPNFVLPIIDLEGVWEDPGKRKQIVSKIRDASTNWGFFQVVNHGVPTSVVEEMKSGAHRFFELDIEQKKELFGRDNTKKVVYNTNFDLYTSPSANWRDTILFHMAPDPPEPNDLPLCCLRPDYLRELDCVEGVDVAYNYYSFCPQPDLTLGVTQHTDHTFIAVLVQNHIEGLQVLHQNHCVDVSPMSDSLVVNIGNLLQVMSNDKFTSVEHKVLLKGVEPRVTAISFFGIGYTSNSRLYGPMEELLSEDNPPQLKISWHCHTSKVLMGPHLCTILSLRIKLMGAMPWYQVLRTRILDVVNNALSANE